ncbi:hypothetical protein T05_8335 [Trichinella murrelli]|uniref:Uncharacterized protein n=1 Tax=Trichinella murrelli TaxID=144512 RepID=A0A0V0TKU8_9BILA|nr:hypothetical protein T05_8335 [Trichinella murrelli]
MTATNWTIIDNFSFWNLEHVAQISIGQIMDHQVGQQSADVVHHRVQASGDVAGFGIVAKFDKQNSSTDLRFVFRLFLPIQITNTLCQGWRQAGSTAEVGFTIGGGDVSVFSNQPNHTVSNAFTDNRNVGFEISTLQFRFGWMENETIAETDTDRQYTISHRHGAVSFGKCRDRARVGTDHKTPTICRHFHQPAQPYWIQVDN